MADPYVFGVLLANRERVELALTQLEEFLRYARPSRSNVDRKAIRLLADVLDPAATEAAGVLRGDYGATVRNVRVEVGWEEWGAVVFEYRTPQMDQWLPRSCSIRLFNRIAPRELSHGVP